MGSSFARFGTKTLGILSLLLTSCGPSAPIDVGYVGGSDTGYVAAIIGADGWNTACGMTLVTVHRGPGEWKLYENDHLDADTGFAGLTHGSRKVIEFDGDANPMAAMMAHEFGHAMGLGHSPAGIMRRVNESDKLQYGVVAPGQITPEDCARVLSQ